MAKNKEGGFYLSGRPLPNYLRQEIIDMYNGCESISKISKKLKMSKGTVSKILKHYRLHGSIEPFSCGGKNPSLITDDILELIEIFKILKPSVTATEIRHRLIRDGVFRNDNHAPESKTNIKM